MLSTLATTTRLVATQHRSRITRTEQQQDTVICYVETIEPSDKPDTINQKVLLTKVDNEWKVVEVPMK